jgi:hypothetical protein
MHNTAFPGSAAWASSWNKGAENNPPMPFNANLLFIIMVE